MYATRAWSRSVDVGDGFWLLRHRDIEKLEARRLLPVLLHLVGNRHDVADCLQRVRPHVRLGQIGLDDDLGRTRVGYINGGEVFGRALMRQPQDAAPILGDLYRHALAHAAEATKLVMSNKLEILDDRLVRALACHVLSLDKIAPALRYGAERARSMNSGLNALPQSGVAAIFFSLSRTSACCCIYGGRSDGKPGSTSMVASAARKVSRDIE